MKKVSVKKWGKLKRDIKKLHGAYITQAISQDDYKGKGDIAMPNDENVSDARAWVNENKK